MREVLVQLDNVGHLRCRRRVTPVIPCHPHSAEMAPAELLNDDIPVCENVSELHHMNMSQKYARERTQIVGMTNK